jgi:hypothetical protein
MSKEEEDENLDCKWMVEEGAQVMEIEKDLGEEERVPKKNLAQEKKPALRKKVESRFGTRKKAGYSFQVRI